MSDTNGLVARCGTTAMCCATTGPARSRIRRSCAGSWLRDESLEDGENLPAPEILAAEIVEDLEAALAEFAQIAATLGERPD